MAFSFQISYFHLMSIKCKCSQVNHSVIITLFVEPYSFLLEKLTEKYFSLLLENKPCSVKLLHYYLALISLEPLINLLPVLISTVVLG